MSIQIRAPYPALSDEIILPNPELGDGKSTIAEVQLMRAMDNTVQTHVKLPYEDRFTYTFELTHIKALELLEFLKNHAGSVWRISAYAIYSTYYNVTLVEDSIELNNFRRSVYEGHSNEAVFVDLTFEGA